MAEVKKSTRAIPRCKSCGQPRKGHNGPTGITKCQNEIKLQDLNQNTKTNPENLVKVNVKETPKDPKGTIRVKTKDGSQEKLGLSRNLSMGIKEELGSVETPIIVIKEELDSGENPIIWIKEELVSGENPIVRLKEEFGSVEDSTIMKEELCSGKNPIIGIKEELDSGENPIIEIKLPGPGKSKASKNNKKGKLNSFHKELQKCLREGSIKELGKNNNGQDRYYCNHCKNDFFNVEKHLNKSGHKVHMKQCKDYKACFEAPTSPKDAKLQKCLKEGSIIELGKTKNNTAEYYCYHCKYNFCNYKKHFNTSGGHSDHMINCKDYKACFEASTPEKYELQKCLKDGSIIELEKSINNKAMYHCNHCKENFCNYKRHFNKSGHSDHVMHCKDLKSCFETSFSAKYEKLQKCLKEGSIIEVGKTQKGPKNNWKIITKYYCQQCKSSFFHYKKHFSKSERHFKKASIKNKGGRFPDLVNPGPGVGGIDEPQIKSSFEKLQKCSREGSLIETKEKTKTNKIKNKESLGEISKIKQEIKIESSPILNNMKDSKSTIERYLKPEQTHIEPKEKTKNNKIRYYCLNCKNSFFNKRNHFIKGKVHRILEITQNQESLGKNSKIKQEIKIESSPILNIKKDSESTFERYLKPEQTHHRPILSIEQAQAHDGSHEIMNIKKEQDSVVKTIKQEKVGEDSGQIFNFH